MSTTLLTRSRSALLALALFGPGSQLVMAQVPYSAADIQDSFASQTLQPVTLTLGESQAINRFSTNGGAATYLGTPYVSASAAFESYTGADVLVGVSSTLALKDPASAYIFAQASNSFAHSISMSASIALGSNQVLQGQLITATAVLEQNDVLRTYGNNWQPVSSFTTDPQALNAFIGAGLTASATSQFGLTVAAGGNRPGDTVDASLTRTNVPTVPGGGILPLAVPPELALGVTYYTLAHSNASFDSLSVATHDSVYLDTDAGQTSLELDIFNPGASNTVVGMSISQINCTGDCSFFQASFAEGVVGAGGSGQLTITYTGVPTSDRQADFTFTFADDARVGAAGTRGSNAITLHVDTGAVTAVPEPHDTAMWLAGLGAIGWLGRRRGARGARRGQVLCA